MSARKVEEVADRLEGLITRLEGLLENRSPCREAEYRRLLQETVAVLAATKNSFRSRRLKELRERIETILR